MLMETSFGMDQASVDAMYRTTIEDYVFAPLDYSRSRTCCWDHTTRPMHDIIMASRRTRPPVAASIRRSSS
jgi:hypothetical protein